MPSERRSYGRQMVLVAEIQSQDDPRPIIRMMKLGEVQAVAQSKKEGHCVWNAVAIVRRDALL